MTRSRIVDRVYTEIYGKGGWKGTTENEMKKENGFITFRSAMNRWNKFTNRAGLEIISKTYT